MVRKMTDDEIMDFVHNKVFNDLDGIESHSLFDEDKEGATEGAVSNAMPESHASGGVKITVEPIMAGAQEGGKSSEEEDDDDDLAGMSPIMAQLHGKR